MNRYELAVYEVRSVLAEFPLDRHKDREHAEHFVALAIVERLVAKGVIQSTDPDDLKDFRSEEYRTGPLQPGRTIVGGDRDERFKEALKWTLDEHGETLRRLGEGVDDDG